MIDASPTQKLTFDSPSSLEFPALFFTFFVLPPPISLSLSWREEEDVVGGRKEGRRREKHTQKNHRPWESGASGGDGSGGEKWSSSCTSYQHQKKKPARFGRGRGREGTKNITSSLVNERVTSAKKTLSLSFLLLTKILRREKNKRLAVVLVLSGLFFCLLLC